MEQLFPVYRPNLQPRHIYDNVNLPDFYDDRPYVAINMVSSVDGKITLNQTHQEQKLGSPLDRELMLRIRTHFVGVLRRAETVRANPSLSNLPHELTELRRQKGKPAQPRTIVASRSLDLPITSDYFQREPRVILLTPAASDPAKRDDPRQY